MLFNSFEYVIFLSVVFLAFWGLARARLLRTAFLLAASYVFYMGWNALFVVLIVLSTLVDYGVGRALATVERATARKALLGASIAYNLGVLCVFKYADFFVGAVADVAGALGAELHPTSLRLILPVGVSFYTFQSLSYTIDVYRRRIEPARNLLEFATFVAFFPQLVAGPIVRAKEFLPQFLRQPTLTRRRASDGLFLILLGLFKKVVVADYLAANFVDRVYDDPAGYSSAEAWLAALGYCWQLYADFSGYTDIARGSAALFGFDLPENFARPYRATGPVQFWRRWHMTLGRWVQDYLYIPLGGSRRGRLRTYGNLFVCFLVIGIWHGAGWTFLLFGLWQALGVTINRIWRDWRGTTDPPPFGLRSAAACAANFGFVMVGWTFFRAASVDQLGALWQQMLLANEWWPMRIGVWAWVILIGMPIVHFTPTEWVERARGGFAKLPAVVQALVMLAVGALVIHVGSRQPAPFIYFQF